MPPWDDQPANKIYKQQLHELKIPVPHWWPQRMHVDVVGGDLDTQSVVMHLPIEGDPYIARIPATGEPPGNTSITLTDLDRQRTRYEWVEGRWKWIIFSRHALTESDVQRIRESIS